MYVSVFKNFNEVTENILLPAVLELIQNGRFKKDVENLRALLINGDKKEYDRQKKSLPAFTPSATFTGGRKMEFLDQYTGFIILDLDKLPENELSTIKVQAISDPYTYACFISPSNAGLKILVKTDGQTTLHKQAFEDVKHHYEALLGQTIDPSGKDVTRLCFLSWDPELYYNPESNVFKIPSVKLEHDIRLLVEKIEAAKSDLTNGYKEWLTIGFALADGLGEVGRSFFHRLSQLSSQYEPAACDFQYDKCLRSNGNGITINSLFYLAKKHGITIISEESTDLSGGPSDLQENSIPDKKKGEGKPKNQIVRIENYLNSRYEMRYNIVMGKLEIRKLDQSIFEPITDYVENSILRELLRKSFNCNTARLRNILYSDYCRTYNPFVDYFYNLPAWDGQTDYITQLAETVNTVDNPFWHFCFKKWIVASVASVLNPDVINHTAIIFSGGQGLGKTTWMERLCPPSMKAYMFSGTINPSNKDTFIHLSECWYINLDELENMNRVEIGMIKEILTKTSIRIRRAYGHNNENLPRRASFMGSVNTSQFLNDPTGSRRFLCFEVVSIEYNHSVTLDNVYSQALELVKSGFKFYFDHEDINKVTINNEPYQVRTIEEELLMTWFRKPNPGESPQYLTTSQILTKLASFSKLSTTTGNAITLGRNLKKHNFTRKKKNGCYVYEVKELTWDEVDKENQISPDEQEQHQKNQEDQAIEDNDDLPF